ncbi:MAG TPA: Crp/Fnr family transcriptional regulator [Thermoanaerobaculia bacterium]|nr:Crp/Fnr family transcriptional regulator [Thermoanaerobaculia bacterium]
MSGDDLKEIFLGSGRAGRVQVERHQDIYICGDTERLIYFVESGSVRVSRPSAAGRDCLLRIELAGGIFGELALLEAHERLETATAREKGAVWRMRGSDFWRELRKRDLLEPFVSHLILRMADQDRRIAHLITEPSLRRLGKMLLMLAHRLGTRTREGFRIGTRISHEELADLVGTTRPRVSTFLCDLRRRNLIEVSDNRHLVIHEESLRRFLGDF